MPQKLIQPTNNMTVSASYLNSTYEKKFGFKHYGYDCYGELQAWCQGYGIVTATGIDSMYGNFVQIVYPDVEGIGAVVANYFHFASIGANMVKGNFVTKDSKLGTIGKTGTYASGIHLHTEMRPFKGDVARMVSPFASQHFTKNINAGWFDPLSITYCKTSAPDYQKYATTGDAYINTADKKAKSIT